MESQANNFYLKGVYFNGDAYYEKEESYESMLAAAQEIKEADIEFRKMGESPKNLRASVVRYIGLQLITEIDE